MATALIVGAGITGVCTAEWLRTDGWTVTLIDPVCPGALEQASFGNAGLLSRTSVMPIATPSLLRNLPAMLRDPHSPLFMRWAYLPRLLPWLLQFLRSARAERVAAISPALAALTFDANEQHLALARGTPAEAFIRRGELVSLYRDRQVYDDDVSTRRTREAYGLVPRLLDRKGILERDPNIGPAYQFATVFDDYCWLSSPGGYVASLFRHFLRHGGNFRRGRAVSLEPGASPRLLLDDGEALTGDTIVLASGAWSGKLARTAGIRVRLEAERGYHVALRSSEYRAPHPYFVMDAKFVLTPMEDGLRAAGVAEFGGLDAPASKRPVELIREGVRRVYPGLDFEVGESWMGHRPTTPDSLPVIGEAEAAPNILHAYGGQHIGLTIGAKVGRIVADLAGRRRTNLDLRPYRPDRF
ncbi:MAG: NAD(P)/FAD-dependent oxidoreductase [Mesorhizobium sp.]